MEARLSALITLAALVFLATASPSASAIGEQRLAVRFIEISADPSGLNDGRLPPGVALPLSFRWKVVVPALTVCPTQFVALRFAVSASEPDVTASLANDLVQFGVDPSTNLLSAREYPVGSATFHADVTVILDPGAPALSSVEIRLTAKALAPSDTLSGCNLSESLPVTATYLVMVD